MGTHTGSFAGRIRAIAAEIGAGGKSFTLGDLHDRAGLTSSLDKKRVSTTMRDLVRNGEASRVDNGVYVYIGKESNGLPLQDQMRNLLKIKGSVTVEDLQELGSAKSSAVEWLLMLVRRGVCVACGNGRYELLPGVQIPERNEEKAERLRKWRAKQRAEMAAALDEAAVAIDKARKALESFDS